MAARTRQNSGESQVARIFSGRPPDIFLAYRRADSPATTDRIYEKLCTHFGSNRVFRDIDVISPGDDFPERIAEALKHCKVCILIIGRNWLDGGRLDDPEDIHRIEIEAALSANHVKLVPVVVEQASPPGRADLPDSVRGLTHLSTHKVRTDPDFGRDVEDLTQAVEQIVGRPWPVKLLGATAFVLIIGAVFFWYRNPAPIGTLEPPYPLPAHAYIDKAHFLTGPAPIVNNAPTVSDAVAGRDFSKYLDSPEGLTRIQLLFEDNLARNGPGEDLVVFELGTPQRVTIEVNERSKSVTKPERVGSTNVRYRDGSIQKFPINQAKFDLADFGIDPGASIQSFVWSGVVGDGDLVAAAALNSEIVTARPPVTPSWRSWLGGQYRGSAEGSSFTLCLKLHGAHVLSTLKWDGSSDEYYVEIEGSVADQEITGTYTRNANHPNGPDSGSVNFSPLMSHGEIIVGKLSGYWRSSKWADNRQEWELEKIADECQLIGWDG